MGETRVDLHHLLEDLRDAYPGSIEETILTEIVANSLDSGASRVAFAADPAQATLTVVDDGSGMQRRELARYHDIAASTKTRGEGIGFAGVGIKLGLLVCDEVTTETRRASTHVATRWHLASRHRAEWKWMSPPPGLLGQRGTAVRLKLGNALSPLLDAGYVEATLRRHYEPLFDPAFDPLLSAHYRHGVHFEVNGKGLERGEAGDAVRAAGGAAGRALRAPLAIKLARKHKPSAIGYLTRESGPLPEDRRGVAISTFGKVIKRGWEWLGLTPAAPDLVGGTIEVPALAECLTLNKGDFIRTGTRGATYLAYRKAIQEAVSRQLAEWGDVRDQAEQARRRVARPMERDLENVLLDLAEEFPLLASLVERRAGGQRKLPIGGAGAAVNARGLVAASLAGGGGSGDDGPGAAAGGAAVGLEEPPADETAAGLGEPPAGNAMDAPAAGGSAAGGMAENAGGPTAHEEQPGAGASGGWAASGIMLPGKGGTKRPARYGLGIQFESREGDAELGRLVESTVWVNDAHPAYRRAMASHSQGYHIALAVAMALSPLAVEPAQEHHFVTAFLAQWGGALERRTRGRSRRS